MLGHPSTKTWPDLEHLQHWHDNTENVRVKRAEYPSTGGQLDACVMDGMKLALPLWATGELDWLT